MTTLSSNLQTLGLTENQTDVYLVLMRKGSAKAGEIIESTGFHRNIVYTALSDLEKMKLVSRSSVRGVALYKILSPARLVAAAKEKCYLAEAVAEELTHLQQQTVAQEIVVFEGIDEFRRHAIRSYSLAAEGALLRYLGVSPHWHDVAGKKVEQQLITIQNQKNLEIRGIAIKPFTEIESWITEGKLSLRFNKLIGHDTNNIEILEDRICIQSFVEPYSVVEIINPEMAKNYQRYFDFLWEQSEDLDSSKQ